MHQPFAVLEPVGALGPVALDVAAGDVLLDPVLVAQQRVAEAAAAAAGGEVEVAGLDRDHHRVGVLLELVLAGEGVHRRLLAADVADRVGLAGGGLLEDVGAEDVVDVGARCRVAAEEPGRGQHPARADVLDLEVLGAVDQQQGLEGGAAAVAAEAAGVGLDPAAEVDHRLDQLPHLDVAHVALGVEHGGAVVEPVEHVLGALALGADLEVHEAGDLPVLVEPAALGDVAGDGVGGDDLLDVAARLQRPRDRAQVSDRGREHRHPGERGGAGRFAEVGPAALGQEQLGRVVGAVVDLVVADQRLREEDPLHPLLGRGGRVEGVPAPGRGAAQVGGPAAVAVDHGLVGAVDDQVALGALGQVLLVGVAGLGEAGRAVAPGHQQAADTGLEVTPAVLDRLAHELLERLARPPRGPGARPRRGSCGSRRGGCARRAGRGRARGSASSTRLVCHWASVSPSPIFMQWRSMPSSKRVVGATGTPPGVVAPMSITWITPPAQPSSSSGARG